ncbi:MAG: response regulator [Candidatus Peribacteraceae bacterium]
MRRILIVEDDPLLVRIYSVRFREEGFESEIATDGAQALESVRKNPSQLILLDLVMPGMDGYAFLTAYRKEGLPAVPIIVLSNLDQPADIRKAKELGVTDFIVKGASDLDKIVARIRELFPPESPASTVPPTQL